MMSRSGLSDATFERAKALVGAIGALENIDRAGARGGRNLPEGSIAAACTIHSAIVQLLKVHLDGFLDKPALSE